MKTALIIVAPGFEEIEAISVIDILRRAKVDVTIAGLDTLTTTGSHDISIIADSLFIDVSSSLYDVLILPGGEPGTTHLENNSLVSDCIQHHIQNDKIVAAICASPRILDKLGYLTSKDATSHPSMKTRLTQCIYKEDRVVTTNQVITSRGPGTALEFALAILTVLGLTKESQELKESMLIQTQ